MKQEAPTSLSRDSSLKTAIITIVKYTVIKTITYIAMVLSSGLMVFNVVHHSPIWKFWLVIFTLFIGVYYAYLRPKILQEKEHEIYTILPQSARKALLAHRKPKIKRKQLPLLKHEEVYWIDQMRTNYYQSKPHVFYLTNLRFFCLDEDFHFVHRLQDLKFDFNLTQANVVNIQVKKANISFLCPSKTEMELALNLIDQDQSL